MSEYKRITFEEIQKLSAKIQFWNDVPVEEICNNITEFFGSNASRVVVRYADEYNDEGYDFRVSDIEVFDRNNQEMELDEKNTKNIDKFYDFKYNLRIGSGSSEGDRESVDFTIDIKDRVIVGEIPELYVKV